MFDNIPIGIKKVNIAKPNTIAKSLGKNMVKIEKRQHQYMEKQYSHKIVFDLSDYPYERTAGECPCLAHNILLHIEHTAIVKLFRHSPFLAVLVHVWRLIPVHRKVSYHI